MASEPEQHLPSIAVIGLGSLGLVGLKNLLEEGFDVTGFERNPYPGGLWKYTENKQTSVLESTVVNISKERGCFTDFPFPDDTNSYPTAAEVHQYLLDYAKHFQLEEHMRLNTAVKKVIRDDDASKWIVVVASSGSDGDEKEEKIAFDKVLIANGTNNVPNIPRLEGEEIFGGRMLHAIEFKKPEEFKDKRVVVIGIGNTAADTATSLVGIAQKIYIAHHPGSFVLPRLLPNGKPIDHNLSYRKTEIQYFMTNHFPNLADKMAHRFVEGIQNRSFNIKPEFRLSPAPPFLNHVPIISDTFIDELEAGRIKSVEVPTRVVGPSTVELEGGKGETVQVDTLIWATGYGVDYSIVGEFDPTLADADREPASSSSSKNGQHQRHQQTASTKSRQRPNKKVPLLYRNIFSLQHPSSLAFLGTAAFPSPAFQTYDIASMAIAQLWKKTTAAAANNNTTENKSKSQNKNYPFPPFPEMLHSVDQHLQWTRSIAAHGTFNPRLVQAPQWMAWAEETAGLEVGRHLGYTSLHAWIFWFRNRDLCRLLMDGILSPHLYRLFERDSPAGTGARTGRKAWPGARLAIEKMNRDAQEKSLRAGSTNGTETGTENGTARGRK